MKYTGGLLFRRKQKMGISKWGLWRSGFIRGLKYMVSSPKRMQEVFFIHESGVLSIDQLPMGFGWVDDITNIFSWLVIHKAKFSLEGHEGSLLDVCERDYYPLDMWNQTDEDEEGKRQELDQVALSTYHRKMIEINAGKGQGLLGGYRKTIAMGCIVLIALMLILGKVF